ncbi:hypothetical protein IM043_gp230 [Bacillus phage SPG24]|nr:hypothetical protein IM043_gp230 [Bacillus phage SPG24]
MSGGADGQKKNENIYSVTFKKHDYVL